MSSKNKKAHVTQIEIADQLGLSFVTVNRAMNGKGGMREDTRKRIMDAAERIGYRKNMLARGLAKHHRNAIGLMLCGSQSGFFGSVALGIQARARSLGYETLLSDSEMNLEVENGILASMEESRVAGIIVQPATERKEYDAYQSLRERGVPILMINNRNDLISDNFIGSDDESGTLHATKHLIGLGHQRIAFLGGGEKETPARNRLSGYLNAMQGSGLSVIPEHIFHANGFDPELVPMAIEKMMSLSNRPTAFVAVTDAIAIFTVNKLSSIGFGVPDEVSVIGYSNMPENVYSPVPLTTMDQHPYEMGCRAAEIIINLVNNQYQQPYVEFFEDMLIERDSCMRCGGSPLT